MPQRASWLDWPFWSAAEMARALILSLRPPVDGGVPAQRNARMAAHDVLALALRRREAKAPATAAEDLHGVIAPCATDNRPSNDPGELRSMPDLTAGPAGDPFRNSHGDIQKGPCSDILSRKALFALPQLAWAWG